MTSIPIPRSFLLVILFLTGLVPSLLAQATSPQATPPAPASPVVPVALQTNPPGVQATWRNYTNTYVLPTNVEVFTIPTTSPENLEVPFYVRPPKGYDPAVPIPGKIYRTLLIIPFLNADARGTVIGGSLLSLADEKGWFVVAPTLHLLGDPKDPKISYYYPEQFSGKAILTALDQIAKKYPIDVNHLLLKGLSGGAQFVHRFALWAPERVTAVVVNSSSWFDDPNPKASKVAWLVTVGESDPASSNSGDFISKLQACGADPIFRAYFGQSHGGDGKSGGLTDSFLSFYDQRTAGDLGKPIDTNNASVVPPENQMPFVGDSQNWRMVTNTPENLENIDKENRIFLPSPEIAKAWGKGENNP